MPDRLVELLRSSECRPLLLRLRKKLQRGETLTGRCRLSQLQAAQAARISELTGSKPRGNHLTINLNLLAQVVINTGRFKSLEELVELACGEKILNLRALRKACSSQWQEVWAHAEKRLDALDRMRTNLASNRCISSEVSTDTLRQAVAAMRAGGWLRRLTTRDSMAAKSLLDQSFDLLTVLPVAPTPLPIFAARHCGDAHALDANRSLGRIVFQLLAARRAQSSDQRKAVTRRQVWEDVGIVTDELSSTVLALNLPAVGDSLSDRVLREHLQQGMPVRLTFRHLRLHEPTFACPEFQAVSCVYLCENPSILAEAANRLGARCPPLICVEGHPSLACWVLLDQLCQCGYRLAYNGDFDWGGIRIANKIYAAFGFDPWRFTSSAHHTYVANHRKLKPPESQALWDATLAETIRRAGVSVEEEAMIDELIADLELPCHPFSGLGALG